MVSLNKDTLEAISTTSSMPDWFDAEKFHRGRKFIADYLCSVYLSYFCALLVGFGVEDLAEALIFTGLSVGIENSRRRYLSTAYNLFLWHYGDIFQPDSSAAKSLAHIRSWHENVKKEMIEKLGRKSYFTQKDFSLVQSGFVGPVILYPVKLGISCTEKQLDDFVYYWRVIGHQLGITDAHNICKSLNTAKTVCKLVEQEIIVPNLENMSKNYEMLSRDFIAGMKKVLPLLSRKGLFAFIFPNIGLPLPDKMTCYDWLVLILLKLQCYLLYMFNWYRNWCNSRFLYFLLHLKDTYSMP